MLNTLIIFWRSSKLSSREPRSIFLILGNLFIVWIEVGDVTFIVKKHGADRNGVAGEKRSCGPSELSHYAYEAAGQ